jgi:hypothetical protein
MSEALPSPSAFEAQYQRVFEAAGCRTQVELAAVLDVRQSSVSDAKRRQSIPAEWRMKLFEKKRINPQWILSGEGGKYLIATDTEGKPQIAPVERITEIRPPENCSSQELFNELVRRSIKER